MKKILILLMTIASYVYAIPPCELPEQKVCAYVYHGAMSTEVIITNLSAKPILVKYIEVVLDKEKRTISNVKLASGQNYSVLKSQRANAHYNVGKLDYELAK